MAEAQKPRWFYTTRDSADPSTPAVTTLLFKVCGNDPGKFEEATRLIELFVAQALKELVVPDKEIKHFRDALKEIAAGVFPVPESLEDWRGLASRRRDIAQLALEWRDRS